MRIATDGRAIIIFKLMEGVNDLHGTIPEILQTLHEATN